jgi:hypothetical protein
MMLILKYRERKKAIDKTSFFVYNKGY